MKLFGIIATIIVVAALLLLNAAILLKAKPKVIEVKREAYFDCLTTISVEVHKLEAMGFSNIVAEPTLCSAVKNGWTYTRFSYLGAP